MCEYCEEADKSIHGKVIRTNELKSTLSFNKSMYNDCLKPGYDPRAFNMLELFILKGKRDKKAGLMLYAINGARYIDINYCPMCR